MVYNVVLYMYKVTCAARLNSRWHCVGNDMGGGGGGGEGRGGVLVSLRNKRDFTSDASHVCKCTKGLLSL